MKLKKIILFFIILIVSTTFFIGAKGSSEKQSSVTTVEFWHPNSGLLADAMNEIVNEFNQTIGKEKNIVVNAIYQGKAADVATKLRASLQANRPKDLPDLAQVDATGVMDVRDSVYMVAVEDLINRDLNFSIDELQMGTRLSMNYKGKMIGMPFNASTILLYYNKDAFREAGLDPDKTPQSLDELAETAALLTKKSSDGKTIERYGFVGVPTTYELVSWIGQQNGLSYLTDKLNGHEGNPTHVLFDKEGTLARFLEKWKSVYDAGGLGNITSDPRQQFVAQKTAMFVASTSSLSTVIDSVDNKFEVGVGYLPKVDENSNGGVNIGGGAIFVFDNSNDLNKVATWEFLKYLTSAEVQFFWHKMTGYFPVNNKSYELKEFKEHLEQNKLFKVAIDQLNDSNPLVQSVWWPNAFQAYYEVQNAIVQMLEKGVTISETVTNLANTLNGFMDEYNRMNREL
ncbi:MAG: ABC transporter substrate-binding protein [Sphaerochaetaceae bacterium]